MLFWQSLLQQRSFLMAGICSARMAIGPKITTDIVAQLDCLAYDVMPLSGKCFDQGNSLRRKQLRRELFRLLFWQYHDCFLRNMLGPGRGSSSDLFFLQLNFLFHHLPQDTLNNSGRMTAFRIISRAESQHAAISM